MLITGETGSGKSTTLAAVLNRINHTACRHIITLEDPIEYIYTSDQCLINQREIGKDTASYADGLRAILHLTYHSSTACCEGEATSALCFVERCKQQGVDFYLAPLKQKPETGHCYTTTDALLKAGAIPLYGISPEAAYAKLLLAYHLPNKDPKKWMQQPRYFEQSE